MTENKGDLISREALKKAINDNGYSHYFEIFAIIDNAPTVEPTFKPVAEVKFDKEQLQEIVDKAKAEVLASVKRPQGEWKHIIDEYNDVECPFCGFQEDGIYYNYCPKCGADMRPKPNQLRDCENCIHHSDNGCEVWECEFKRRSS